MEDLDQRMYCLNNLRVSPLVSVSFVIVIASYSTCFMGRAEIECVPNCLECFRGDCTECKPGMWGPDCKKECIDCWRGKCDRNKGRCIECSPGLYTENCNKTCPDTCGPGNDNLIHCNRETRECIKCEFGIEGKFCERNITRIDHLNVATFELNVVAEGRRAAEQGFVNSVWGRLGLALILILTPFVVVVVVHVLSYLISRIHRKVYSFRSKSDKREEETSIPLSTSVNCHETSQRNGD